MLRVLILLPLFLSLGRPLQAQFATGLEFTDPSFYLSFPLASTPLMGLLPRSADLSPFVPAPGDQGQQASCVGWAVAYAMKSYQEGVERRWPLDQPSAQFSPAYVYNQIRRSQTCTGGTMFPDALDLLRRAGAAPLSEFPYSEQVCSAMPDAATRQRARVFAIADWRRVETRDQIEVKAYIAAEFPVMIGMMVDQEFMQFRGAGTYNRYSGNSLGGHAMLVVGYDDSRSAFKVMNSWGPAWGDGGFGWISYAAFQQAVREGYIARDITPMVPASLPILPQTPPATPGQGPTPATAQVAVLEIAHDATIGRTDDAPVDPGVNILVRGTVLNGIGHSAQLVVRFTLPDGTALPGDPENTTFRDVRGLVAATTAPTRVMTSPYTVSRTIRIPYSVLEGLSARRAHASEINAVATIYLNNFEIARSEPRQLTPRR